MTYNKMFGPQYLPATIDPSDVSHIERRLRLRKRYRTNRIEIMTDQIDVYLNDRKIACYMP